MKVFEPVKFKPIPQPRVWGGHQLKAWFDVEAMDNPIGEYWVLSGHETAPSVVLNGELAGKSLSELTSEFPHAYLGNSPQPRFPILIKFLEASADLSVQLHPDDSNANAYEGDYGKAEAWYVLDCVEDGHVNYGHRFKSREELLQAFDERRIHEYLQYESIRPGQLVHVPARTVHALLAGTIVIEVQQTSDATYRIYDWNRVDEEGNGRQLHVERAVDLIEYGEQPPFRQNQEVLLSYSPSLRHDRLIATEHFTIERLVMNLSHCITQGHEGNPDIIIVADGTGVLRYEDGESLPFQRGDSLLVPATIKEYVLEPKSELTLLRVFY